MNETVHVVSDTPRTNAAAIEINRPGDGDKLDWISFARQLERELSKAKTDLEASQIELEEVWADLQEAQNRD